MSGVKLPEEPPAATAAAAADDVAAGDWGACRCCWSEVKDNVDSDGLRVKKHSRHLSRSWGSVGSSKFGAELVRVRQPL